MRICSWNKHDTPPTPENREELETPEHHGTAFFPVSFWPRQGCGADLAAGVTVVSSQCEAEVTGTVHAHHHMGNWHQYRCSLSQGHPQLLTGLRTHTGQDSSQNRIRTRSLVVKASFKNRPLASLQGPPNVQSPAA